MLLTSIEPLPHAFERQGGQVLDNVGATMPMDVIRRPEELLLRFDVPGIDPDSIEVTVDRGVLSVTATREETSEREGGRFFVRERRTGVFTRRVHLPDHLDADHVQAAYQHGELAVRIPVREAARPRRIEITRGDATGPAA
ncbi:Hsp20/alpha crystallin family protein [Nonomuraea sp. NPDC050783]|uniref:Hsp20/alpha crystallin family protein n=1 Tax=Nonomuraea sp. NPDC050783 TaxID=3154634 RepID=UPI00346604F1